MPSRKFLNIVLSLMMIASLLILSSGQAVAQRSTPPNNMGQGGGNDNGKGQMRSMTVAARQAARLAQAPQQKGVSLNFAGLNSATAAFSPLAAGAPALATMSAPLSNPDYFGVANWAVSQLPQIDPATGLVVAGTGIEKFVNTLPGLAAPGANIPGQYIPLGVPDTATFPGADYYEIGLVQYRQVLANNVPATLLRGYVQLTACSNAGAVPLSNENLSGPATPILVNGLPVCGRDNPHYLGPTLIAQEGRPVRVTFTNLLPTGAAGDLFIPADTTYMGAGMGPLCMDGSDPNTNPNCTRAMYTENRATLHLHGGNTPWISDGTTHQWTVPVGEGGVLQKGLSAQPVPDMWFDASGNLLTALDPNTGLTCQGQTACAVPGATTNPGQGKLTFYWTNQQSGRLLFFHDHAYGITRLNVYAGEAAGYLIGNPAEEAALKAATVPGTISNIATLADTANDLLHLVPLVVQDKTFVPDNGAAGGQLAATDPTWDLTNFGGQGNLWFPHVYMPNQNPADVSGANAFGRWDYGPWFWPPQDPTTFVPGGQPYQCTSVAFPNPPALGPLVCPGTPNPSGVPEGFMDTPIVNGEAYPTMTVDPTAYRFQILNAANDRYWALGLYKADPLAVALTNGGSGYDPALPPAVTFNPNPGGATAVAHVSTGQVTGVTLIGVGVGYFGPGTPTVTIDPPTCTPGPACIQATATAVIDPIVGQVTAINVTNTGAGYTAVPNVAVQDPALVPGDTKCIANGGSVPCAPATATAQLTGAGVLVSITVTNPGAGWTGNPAVVIDPPPAGGTQAYALASVNTEVKMADAVPHNAGSAVPLCNINPTVSNGDAGGLVQAVLDPNGQPLSGTGLQAGCWPTTWPTDGRDGGVPDPSTAGPPIIQIGAEGGLLPAPVVIPSTPMGYEYNRRSITVLNVFSHGLFLGPAERADVVVDFSQFAGQTLIMYNDSPAPVPAFDPRIDYYTGDPDQTDSGGAPSTMPGYGPNTRTIMQIKVNGTMGTPVTTPFNLPTLRTQQGAIFAAGNKTPTVPEPVYPAGHGGAPNPTYAAIQDTSMSAWLTTGVPIGGLTLTAGGFGYTAAPNVTIAQPTTAGGSTATGTAQLTPTGVGSLTLNNSGAGYSTPPVVTIAAPTTTGTTATATAVLAATGSVKRVTVTSGGRSYTTAPTVTFAAPNGCTLGAQGCTRATGNAVLQGNRVGSITITNGGAGYPTGQNVSILIQGGGGTGAAATATLGFAIASFTGLPSGLGYIAAPSVTIAAPTGCSTGGQCTTATATTTLSPTSVKSVTLTSGGSGYTAPPNVTITPVGGGPGGNASAVATAAKTRIEPKAIQELFTLDYGRMNATLGVEVPFTNFLTQTTIPYGYVDPPTEIFKDGDIQIWKFTHNGVDTHAIHFHLYDVQVINRVGWDGMIKPPDPNEVGWKDTVRMNPLEDIILAIRPSKQTLPWDLPNSIRPLDVTEPVGVALPNQFTNIDPTNEPAVVTNDMTNFGWEYVVHCHLLGHEENDMMRAQIMAVPPRIPTIVSAINNTVIWTDNSLNETGFTIMTAPTPAGPWTIQGTAAAGQGAGTQLSFKSGKIKTGMSIQVVANNLVGYTKTYAAPAVGYPHLSADSPSLVATVQ